MISSQSCSNFSPFISLLFYLLISPNPLLLLQCHALPAGVESILDPLGDMVQVAPSLALHQQEAEKISESSIKSIKTPSGTVKCSCQTVSTDEATFQEDYGNFPSDPLKTIEIEIFKPKVPIEDDDTQIAEESKDRIDVADESQAETVNHNQKTPQTLLQFARNSFTLDGDEDAATSGVGDSGLSSQDRVFNSREPISFLSFLSQLVSSSAQAQALQQQVNQPEKIETEADQEESDQGDLANLNMNLANHRMLETSSFPTPLPSPSAVNANTGIYKAFRSTDLIGERPLPLSPSSTLHEDNSEKMKSVDDGDSDKNFFLWDFIYADHAATLGKKRELLQLGTVADPFKGPRRRRRRRRSLRGNMKDNRVVFVYPVGTSSATAEERSSQEDEVVIPENQTNQEEMSLLKLQLRSDVAEVVDIDDKEEIQKAMQAAMHRAWEQYGPKGLDAPPVTPRPPAPVVVIPASQQPPQPPLPSTDRAQPKIQQHQQNSHQLVYYSLPRPFLFTNRIFNPFQPMTSEWDEHVTTYNGPLARPPEPGIFSRLLASYIDFEVNNHETADLMRKVVFGVFVGFLIAGWIALGVALGIVPLKKIIALVAGTHYDTSDIKRIDKGKEFQTRDATLAELTDKILLSLDADWLKRLEERVMGSGDTTGGNGGGATTSKIPTQVFCCVLPDEQTKGMVECQVSRGSTHHHGKKKTSAFKCISDLIYNFRFGPKDNETEEEQDNVVNVKSKANSDTGRDVAEGGLQSEQR